VGLRAALVQEDQSATSHLCHPSPPAPSMLLDILSVLFAGTERLFL
jgi:hypothetical protein